jgi:hypothetical protein
MTPDDVLGKIINHEMLFEEATMSRIFPRVSLLQENKILPSKLAIRAKAKKWWKKAQVKKEKMMIVMMRASNMMPMRWLFS